MVFCNCTVYLSYCGRSQSTTLPFNIKSYFKDRLFCFIYIEKAVRFK